MPFLSCFQYLKVVQYMFDTSETECNFQISSETTIMTPTFRWVDMMKILLFPVDRDTDEFFCRLQSNVFDAASLFQINQVVH